jgi:hypothetical protein
MPAQFLGEYSPCHILVYSDLGMRLPQDVNVEVSVLLQNLREEIDDDDNCGLLTTGCIII